MKYNTDKQVKGLLAEYEKLFAHLKKKKVKLLEVGVYECGFLDWATDYFDDVEIYGMDYRRGSEKYKVYNVDQNDSRGMIRMMKEIGDVDIIVDDGSHLYTETKKTYDTLIDFVKPEGIYIIEDWWVGFWTDEPHKKMMDLMFDIVRTSRKENFEKVQMFYKRPNCTYLYVEKSDGSKIKGEPVPKKK